MEAVVVGVRVRPFNDREKGLNATVCIDMQGATTVITGPSGIPQNFAFDQSFWSHDEFITEADGYCRPQPGGRYADQRYVYDTFGQRVLDNAWAGYHCCLFAYGQTGAGKSYSMVGYGANKGIVPISCEEIFKRVNSNSDSGRRYEIQVSMVEIYNETVQDLFIPFDSRPKNGFQIRESKALGIYVDGIVKHAVDSYAAIEKAIDQGTANRSVGSTQMNATSSRAHTVITIEFKQVEKFGGTENVKVSNINLIDLAGSEKAAQTGATGDRLKEGSAINKSLSALGNVIEKLAERSQGKTKKGDVVPYRDSKLTRLLQNALGGSSKTIMICALSPASSNFEETLSTLRYADRAKKIKNSAVINENPQEKLMRELREENAKLKGMLEAGGIEAGSLTGEGLGAISDEARQEQQDKIAQLQMAMEDMQKSFQDKMQEAKKRDEETRASMRGKVGRGNPLIVNLNSEMQLTAKLRFEFPGGKEVLIGGTLSVAKAGRGSDSEGAESEESQGESDDDGTSDEDDDDDSRPSILLSSPGVLTRHAKVANKMGQCYIRCIGEAGAATWINGVSFAELLENRRHAREDEEAVAKTGSAGDEADEGSGGEEGDEQEQEDLGDVPADAVLLRHCDRLVMGRAIFLFVDPQQGIVEMLIMSGLVSYAKARKELPSTWRERVNAGGEKATHFQSMIRDAVSRGLTKAGSSPALMGREESGEPADLTGRRSRTGSRKSTRSVGSMCARTSSGVSRGEESDSDASSLGDGATHDEVLITRLKDELAARDREIEMLRQERDEAQSELQVCREDCLRLRRQLDDATISDALAAAASVGGPRMSMSNTVTRSRADFNDKVAGMERSFKQALSNLDSTRQGLTKAMGAFDGAWADARSRASVGPAPLAERPEADGPTSAG